MDHPDHAPKVPDNDGSFLTKINTIRQRLRELVDGGRFQTLIMWVIVINAVTLGLEALPQFSGEIRPVLNGLDIAFMAVFVGEIALRLFAHGPAFFKNGWNVFDFVVIAISTIALSGAASAFRAFRVLRVMHLITVMPRMKLVVSALFHAIPGIVSVGVVLLLIVFVFAVLATNLFGPAHPALFGDLFTSMYTLFQVMTLEGWPDIANSVKQTYPMSWLFFVVFLLVGTFTMLNLFVAIVVRVIEEDSEEVEGLVEKESDAVRADIAALRLQLAQIEAHLARLGN